MPQRPILVADDIDNQTDAGKRRSGAVRSAASSLAARLHADIELLYVEDIKSHPPPKFDAPHIRAWHSKHQDGLNEAVGQFPIPVRGILKGGSPPQEILQTLCARTSPELVVMGTQGRKGLKRLLVGSVAEEVIRHAKRPVMVIGPLAQEKDRDFFGRKQPKILVATDLGKNSRPAEHYALSLAKRTGARAVLFHCLGDSYRVVIHDCSAVSGWVPVNLDEILRHIRDDAVIALKRKTRFYQNRGVLCEYRIEEQEKFSSCAIYREAEKGYDLVVMGTHGRNVLVEGFFGSTARETIFHAPIPVITVRSAK